MDKKKFVNRFNSLLKEYAFIDNDDMNHVNEYLDDDMIYEDGEEDDEIGFDSLEDDSMTNAESEVNSDDAMGMNQEPEPAIEPKPEVPNDEFGAEVEEDGGEIELDVTELVNKTDDASRKADATNAKLDDLLAQIDTVLQSSVKIDQLATHIDSLQDEIIKRNPSKIEKLELQSLHSAPYNIKLGEYWDDKLGDYATDISSDRPTFNDLEGTASSNVGQVNQQTASQPQEIVITQDDVNSGYNETSVKNSFDDYEEEEISDY